jgi:hypothetical protein
LRSAIEELGDGEEDSRHDAAMNTSLNWGVNS